MEEDQGEYPDSLLYHFPSQVRLDALPELVDISVSRTLLTALLTALKANGTKENISFICRKYCGKIYTEFLLVPPVKYPLHLSFLFFFFIVVQTDLLTVSWLQFQPPSGEIELVPQCFWSLVAITCCFAATAKIIREILGLRSQQPCDVDSN